MAWRDLKVGDLHFAVRTDSWELTAWLDHALEAYIVDEEADVKYSFVVGDASDAVSKTFSIFYWGTVPVVKTLHFPTAIDAFLTELEVMQMSPRTDGVFLRAVPVTDGTTVGLVPVSMIMGMGDETRTATRAGLSFGACMAVRLDPSTGTVSPVPRSLAVPDDISERLGEVTHSTGPDRFELTADTKIGVVFAMSTGPINPDANLMEPASRASTLYRTAPWILNLDAYGTESFEVLAGMLRGAQGYTLTPISDRTRLFEALVEGLRGTG